MSKEITIKSLVDKYLKAKGLKRVKGADNDASPLLPLIMMDSAFQLFDKYVKKVECRHEMKKWKNEWLAHYHRFNRDFFRCYDGDETDFIIDMMDTFEEYIANDMTITFVQFTNLFKNESFDRQKVLSACMLSNILCQCAEIIWERVYYASLEKKNQDIIACEKYMHKWSDMYYGYDKPNVNPNNSKPICDAVSILCAKQVKFLNIYRNENRTD